MKPLESNWVEQQLKVGCVGNQGGFILSKERHEPPSDIEKYYAMNVAQQIKDEYIKILS